MLNTEQVQYIRKVLQKRGIETIDLLEEMTDHFVLAIEERENELRHTTLRELLRQEVAKFGAFGMMKLEQDYKSKLEKQGYQILWRTFKSFWRIPQFIISLSFFYFVFLVIQEFQFFAVLVLKYVLITMAFIYMAVTYYLRFSLGRMAIFTKLYTSVFMINIPILSTFTSVFYQTNSNEFLDLQSQLIATALLGTYLLLQFAGAIILYRSFGEIQHTRKLSKA